MIVQRKTLLFSEVLYSNYFLLMGLFFVPSPLLETVLQQVAYPD